MTRAALHELIDSLPDDRLTEAGQRLADLCDDPALRAALLAPADDEPLTDEDLAAIGEGREELARGLGVPSDEVRRQLGW
jgi:hypothetical protein